MRTWKHADWIIQIILLLAGIIIALGSGFRSTNFFPGYFILGGWQTLSFLVNMIWRKGQWKIMSRKIYGIILLVIVIIGIVLYAGVEWTGYTIIPYLVALLYVSPILAVWYITICYREWQLIRTKDFMHLK